MIIKYGNTDITNLILEYERKGSVDDENVLLLGNAPSYQINLKIDNESKILQTLSGMIQVFDDENNLKGTYLIYESPSKYTDVMQLTCLDKMLLTNIPYDSKLTYPTTIKGQLDEISSLTGLTIDYSNLPIVVLNQSVDWWDNTLSCRNYLGWIAEIAGMNIFADPEGNLKFKPLKVTTDWQTDDVEDYETDEVFTISRVCFDNGLLKLAQGDESGNTLYLSSNNPYIDSNNDPTQRLLNAYKNLSIISLAKMKLGGLDDLKLFDVIGYQDMKFLCLDLKSTYKGGEYQIQEISGKLSTKNADKVTIKYDDTVRMKRIKVEMDENKQKLDIIAKEQENQNEKQTKFELFLDGIKESVKKVNSTVDTLKNSISVSLSTNYVANQSYEQATKKYAPDYTLTPLKIMATVTDSLMQSSVAATIAWTRKVQDSDKWTALTAGESVSGNTLTISHNLAKTTQYRAVASVKVGTTQYTAEKTITINVNILEDTTIKGDVCKIEASSYCFTEMKEQVESVDEQGNITTETVSVYNPGNITLTPKFFNCNFDCWQYSADLGTNFTVIEPTGEPYQFEEDDPSAGDENIVRVKVNDAYLEGVHFNKKKRILTVYYDADCFDAARAVVFKLKSDVDGGSDTVTLTLDGDYETQYGNLSDALDALKESYTSIIQELDGLEGTITTRIEQSDAIYTDMFEDVQKQISEIIQTASDITETFTSVKEWVDENGSDLEQISTYIRRSSAGIEVGEVDAAVKTLMGTSYFAILLNDSIAMKLEKDLLTIKKVLAQSGLQLGKNIFTANSVGFRITWGG